MGMAKAAGWKSSARMRHSEPSLSVSLLPKKCYEPWREAAGQGEKKQVKEEVMNVN